MIIYDADQDHKEDGEKKREEAGEEKWPQSSPSTLCECFFGGMAVQREKLMGTRPHYCTSITITTKLPSSLTYKKWCMNMDNAKYTDLDMLATHPAHHAAE